MHMPFYIHIEQSRFSMYVCNVCNVCNVCMHVVCMYLCTHASTYVCVRCMYVSMVLCSYVCMYYIWDYCIYVCACGWLPSCVITVFVCLHVCDHCMLCVYISVVTVCMYIHICVCMCTPVRGYCIYVCTCVCMCIHMYDHIQMLTSASNVYGPHFLVHVSMYASIYGCTYVPFSRRRTLWIHVSMHTCRIIGRHGGWLCMTMYMFALLCI
jgi:hypothetical protein